MSVCVEMVVGPLHHSSVEGWARQQHSVFDTIASYGEDVQRYSVVFGTLIGV